MTTSQKYAALPDIDLSGHDVYETTEAVGLGVSGGGKAGGSSSSRRSPTRRRNAGYGSDESTDEEEDDDADPTRSRRSGASGGRGGKEKFIAGEDEVERLGIDASKARERFQGATDSQALESAPARARRRKAGLPKGAFYPPLDTSTYELGLTYPSGGSASTGAASAEDPIARLRRLRFEAEEVERELEARGALGSEQKDAAATATDGEEDGVAKQGPTPKAILSHVRLLRADLARLEKRTGIVGQGKSEGEGKRDELGSTRAKLIGNIGKGVESDVEGGQAQAAAAAAATTGTATAGTTEGLGRIDARLKELEDLVGVGEIEVLDEHQRIPRPLLPSLSRIEHLLSLITHPRHLDGISRRVKVLVTELDRAHEARRKLGEMGEAGVKGRSEGDGVEGEGKVQSGMSKETLAKLDEALSLLSRIEPLLPLAPSLLARLRSLSALHASASSFASDVSSLRTLQEGLANGNAELQALLGEVGKSIEENEERSRRNAEEVERRVEDVLKRMEKLEGA